MLDEWARARRTLEERSGHPFDEVYVVGFSSGAYFATSLALRAKLDVDGYVVLAGGAPTAPSADASRHVPVFVGVCARDAASAPEAARARGTCSKGRAGPRGSTSSPSDTA